MGLSIHYSGTIKNYYLIDELMDEAEDISSNLGWKSQLVNDENAKGIIISPQNCEPLWLTFQTNGQLCGPLFFMAKNEKADIDWGLIHTAHTKTQFAGPEVHIALVKLLKFLSNKYFKEINVSDEGMFWETGDEKILSDQFEKYNSMLDMVSSALSDFKAKQGETAESIADRIEKLLLNKLGKEKNNF